MGEYRNSYSKTDHDATFMRMKEDHMLNGQLKPAYNMELASTSGFIIGENISHHPSDMYTLKPFLSNLLDKYPNKLNKIVADAGYESEENYVYLAEKSLNSYIKPSNYEKSKTRKYKKDMEFRKNLKYDEKQDKYTSKEGIEERINCSIQVEGAFSKIKDGFLYDRFQHRGKANIISEINLLAIALNQIN